MKITVLLIYMLLLAITTAEAQKYFTKNGRVSFFSKATLENIKADNNQVTTVLNTQTGDIQFSLLINAFHFEKALMEEHFNDDYLESAKFPKSTFKGTITNISTVTTDKDGSYPVTVTGDLFIHGVTKNITTTGTITIKGGKLSAGAVFNVKPADYNIKIPGSVRNNIAESIQLTVSCAYENRT